MVNFFLFFPIKVSNSIFNYYEYFFYIVNKWSFNLLLALYIHQLAAMLLFPNPCEINFFGIESKCRFINDFEARIPK